MVPAVHPEFFLHRASVVSFEAKHLLIDCSEAFIVCNKVARGTLLRPVTNACPPPRAGRLSGHAVCSLEPYPSTQGIAC
jgi:hypothetical protein